MSFEGLRRLRGFLWDQSHQVRWFVSIPVSVEEEHHTLLACGEQLKKPAKLMSLRCWKELKMIGPCESCPGIYLPHSVRYSPLAKTKHHTNRSQKPPAAWLRRSHGQDLQSTCCQILKEPQSQEKVLDKLKRRDLIRYFQTFSDTVQRVGGRHSADLSSYVSPAGVCTQCRSKDLSQLLLCSVAAAQPSELPAAAPAVW